MAQIRIGLGMDRRNGQSELLLRGIATYARPDRPWVFSWESPTADGIQRLLELDLVGILAKDLDDRGVELIENSQLPAVHMGRRLKAAALGCVDTDGRAVGDMAATYFTHRGYKHFGYYAPMGTHSDACLASFQKRVTSGGHSCHLADPDRVQEWLSALPKPVAILCSSDDGALSIAEHCRELGIVVPDEVAVLGVDNDIPVCALASPPISSVQTAFERMGFAAAEMLNEMMTEGKPPRVLAVPPIRVVSRRSTDAAAASDPLVARALAYMQANFSEDDCLGDFFATIRCSRRTLERKFRETTGLSPTQAWLRFRVEEAERLLADTELSVETVADRSGFGEVRQLQLAFRKVLKQTPSEFRRHAIPSFRATR